jgi:hypothetical protein
MCDRALRINLQFAQVPPPLNGPLTASDILWAIFIVGVGICLIGAVAASLLAPQRNDEPLSIPESATVKSAFTAWTMP